MTTGANNGVCQIVFRNEDSEGRFCQLTPFWSIIFMNHAAKIRTASERTIAILSGSNIRLEKTLKKIGAIIRAANQAASITPSQNRLNLEEGIISPGPWVFNFATISQFGGMDKTGKQMT